MADTSDINKNDDDKDDIPTSTSVMRHFFADEPDKENFEWILFENGTYYLWKKEKPLDPDDMIEEALKMSREAYLIQFKNNDDVGTICLSEFGHPTYIVMSCLQYKIGWVIVGKTKQWATKDNELAAIGYLARTMYEMDCEQNHIIATSFPYDLSKLTPVSSEPKKTN
jgi:hypothetical protein